ETHATDGNWNNRIGVPMTLFGLNKYNKYAVIEAGINQPGEMVHLGQMIRADLVIVTHIGPAHLELLHSLEAIAEEKAHLIRLAKPDAPLVVTAEVYEHSAFRCFSKQSIVLANDSVNLPDELGRVIRYAYTSKGIRLFNMNFEIASPSRGVRTNCALAIVAALNFGIKLETIQQRLALWRPDSNRGFVWRDAKQIFYIDCYNANPSSMMDSLEAFKQTNVGEVARGYVIGAMNELGFQANQFHRSVGRALKLNSSDRVWFVGPAKLTREYCLGAKESGCLLDQIRCEDSVDKLKSDIAEFDGALFLKGSRVYQLETLLPDNFSSNFSN
ncbi:MAG: Mur ligase family protein, partial [Verrucomicrobiota bacterium]|nr:Mur ligase family protein [Verrucomicrobiota bacterium]